MTLNLESKPIIFSDVNLVKDLLIASLTSLLNVRSMDALSLLKNLDDRVNRKNNPVVPEKDCSFQVCNAYYLYVQYLSFIDSFQFEKYQRV